MANQQYFLRLQDQIDYKFNDVALLERALTAPGAEGDKEGDVLERDKYDGNRKLARLGESLLQLIVLYKSLYEEDANRSDADHALKSATFKEHHERRARFFQIDTHMKLNPRQGGHVSTRTLSLAVCAILGACFRDSGNISVVRKVVERFGIGNDSENQEGYVDPRAIHHQNQATAMEGVVGGSDGHSDIAESNTSIGLPQFNVENDLGANSSTSIETFYEIHGNRTPEDSEYSMAPLGSRGIHSWEIHTAGLCDTSMQSHYDIGDLGIERISDVVNRQQLGNMGSASASTPQISLSDFVMDRDALNGNLMSPASSIFENFYNSSIRNANGTPQHVYEDGESTLPSQMRTGKSPSQNIANVSASGRASKKRRSLASKGDKSSSIEAYILLEKTRCKILSLPCPEEGFNSAIRQASIKSPRIEEVVTELKIFFFAIASPEAIAALKAIIKAQRLSQMGKLSVPNQNLPLAERMKQIESLNEDIAYACFLRRCHTRQIFVDSSDGSKKSSDGFINFTPQSISARPRTQIGNPHNLEDSRLSKLIMKEIYPNLKIKSPEYDKKLRSVQKLRKLGERLDLLVEKFGYGILGLLPLAIDVSAVEQVLNITDSLILKIPDDTFRWFVRCLDQLQGDLLRKTSKAATGIVTAIFHGNLDPSRRYGIEKLEQDEVVKHPKGSPMILESLSKSVS